MKKRALRKDFYMEIRKSLGRFLSIFFIVALGVSFFSGIRASEPDMRISGDAYFDEKNLMDIKVISTMGLTKDDLHAIEGLSDVAKAEGGFSQDMLLNIDDNQKVLHVMSIPESMNELTVSEGRMPEKEGECLVDIDFLEGTSYRIGDTITLTGENSGILEVKEFKIVGTGSSPSYISFGRGSSLIGTGTVSGFLAVTDENFSPDTYTEIYVKAAGAKEETAFTEGYQKKVDHVIDEIEKITDARCEARKQSLAAEANKEIDKARQELEDRKASAQQELSDAEQKLKDGETQIQNAKAEIASGKEQIENAKQTLYQKQKELDAGLEEYRIGKETLDSQKEELEKKEKEYQQQAEAAVPQIEAAEKQIADARAKLDAGWQQYNTIKDSEDPKDQAIAAELLKQLNVGEAELKANIEKLTAMKNQLSEGKIAIEQAKEQLSAGEESLSCALQTIQNGQVQIDTAWEELHEKEETLESGENTLQEQEQTLIKSREEYETAKTEAQAKIEEGEQKIKDAEKEIAKIETPTWYVYDRSTLPEYSEYGENADRMRAIGKVFPALFFLVAALISLTTMTRMVEEQRVEIGTLQALGYSKIDIAKKYLNYALLATFGGSVFGVLIGEKLFPFIIVYAYKIMYQHLPHIIVPYHVSYAVMATAAAVLCTFVATLAAGYKELMALPAVLMRPPSPKQGKRIFLERITFIWKHLSFIWKSSIRNLFRYKKRFFMTIIGIGGCMGLMLVGFGLKDSITNIATLQYGELQEYDGMAYLSSDLSEQEKMSLRETLEGEHQIDTYSEVMMKNKTVKSAAGEEEIYLSVPVKEHGLEPFMTFRNRVTKEEYELTNEGVILTEKVATELDVKSGDMITIQEDTGDVKVKVVSVCENYIGNYMYMTTGLYEELYGKEPEENSIMFKMKKYDEEGLMGIGEKLIEQDAVLNVTYTNNMEERIADMLGSLNLVIVVLIISAGMLAFVVLYNLNNINITERKRELATLKVLGFYDKEVASYVFRENILLTIIGSLVGMGIGKILHQFVIVTVEVEGIMFGRNIDFPSFLYSFLFTVGFSLFVNWVMYFKLKRIDMVESLKSVE